MLYIRPILEYASTVWAPYTKLSIEKLEATQKCTAIFVVSDYDYSAAFLVFSINSTGPA